VRITPIRVKWVKGLNLFNFKSVLLFYNDLVKQITSHFMSSIMLQFRVQCFVPYLLTKRDGKAFYTDGQTRPGFLCS